MNNNVTKDSRSTHISNYLIKLNCGRVSILLSLLLVNWNEGRHIIIPHEANVEAAGTIISLGRSENINFPIQLP